MSTDYLNVDQQTAFLKKYNITQEKFRKALLPWEELSRIANRFEKIRDEHEDMPAKYAKEIQTCQHVHSLSYRIKDTEHLIEKIIRKNEEYVQKGKALTASNFSSEITDMFGIRVLLLFKEDWKYVHKHIMNLYGDSLWEPPFAYIRKGDDRSLYEGLVDIKEKKPYRSVHYVIKSPEGYGVEIQVRTLFEEAWSEIDHKLRYPYHLSDAMINSYIAIMNRVAGVSDELGSFINTYVNEFREDILGGVSDDNEVYQYILSEIENCEDEVIRTNIQNKIKQAENYKEKKKFSELFDSMLDDLE